MLIMEFGDRNFKTCDIVVDMDTGRFAVIVTHSSHKNSGMELADTHIA